MLMAFIAALAGALGQAIAGYSLGGCFISAVVGFVGAWLGQLLARQLGLPLLLAVPVGGRSFAPVWSVVGAALFTVVLGALMRPRGEPA